MPCFPDANAVTANLAATVLEMTTRHDAHRSGLIIQHGAPSSRQAAEENAVTARDIEKARTAWGDAVRKLEAALAGRKDAIDAKGAIDAEVVHLRERFRNLSSDETDAPAEALSRSPDA